MNTEKQREYREEDTTNVNGEGIFNGIEYRMLGIFFKVTRNRNSFDLRDSTGSFKCLWSNKTILIINTTRYRFYCVYSTITGISQGNYNLK